MKEVIAVTWCFIWFFICMMGFHRIVTFCQRPQYDGETWAFALMVSAVPGVIFVIIAGCAVVIVPLMNQ